MVMAEGMKTKAKALLHAFAIRDGMYLVQHQVVPGNARYALRHLVGGEHDGPLSPLLERKQDREVADASKAVLCLRFSDTTG